MKHLETRLGYNFKNKSYLRRALTHSSYGYEKTVPHNERLEFLGDAILGAVIAESLFTLHPDVDEGVLSKQKSAIVSEETLAKKASALKLGDQLFLGKGEIRTGGNRKVSILADCVEAIIGAVELDGGFENARRLIRALFNEELEQELLVLKNDQDFKSVLQELSQKWGLGFPTYLEKEVSGPEHSRVFRFQIVIGGIEGPEGKGSSKKRAQQECARKTLADDTYLKKIENLTNEEDIEEREL